MNLSLAQRGIQLLLIPLLLVLLQACGEQDGNAETTELTISLTDAVGDFNQYTVDVASIRLYRSDGAIVETLPNRTRLDFTQYTEVSEFLTTATVPVGLYDRADIALDFGDAEITVEDEDGNAIPASAVDSNGDPLGALEVSILVNADSGFHLRAGAPSALLLDFHLEASNEVVIDGDHATVTVNPVLLASTSVEDDKTRRLRGLLAGVDPEQKSFAIRVRPFRVRFQDYGRITAQTDADTLFEIDGVAYASQAGLDALARQPRPTPVVALGDVRWPRQRFLARQVYAGSSVPWGEQDVVNGSVIARQGDSLTVIGATVEFDDGRFRFNDSIEVLLGAGTRVVKQGDVDNDHQLAEISVGQRITALGEMRDNATLDAGNGLVRMLFSQVSGLVASVSPLQVDLRHVNRRLVERYDFDGTGIDSANDADPGHYEVDSAALSLAGLGAEEPVLISGFPTAFGSAPFDFSAKTVIDLGALPTSMLMAYGAGGSPSAVQSLDQTGLLLDLESALGRHYLKQAGVVTDIATLPAVPLITPADGDGVFAISTGRSIQVYLTWQAWQAALNEALESGAELVLVIATGDYDAAGPQLGTRRLVARITG